ncbi:hypothetical protein AVEN_275105-1 [Araneus ventricosus]|uniref:Uncharacterized protein n=1 Tax=Araneus ventricosus TaxID=182803 RepID=A0A4Y2VC24_ARAVE|nr:hypothetical protein AVEN_275105-1 [Araneus ventricosus]
MSKKNNDLSGICEEEQRSQEAYVEKNSDLKHMSKRSNDLKHMSKLMIFPPQSMSPQCCTLVDKISFTKDLLKECNADLDTCVLRCYKLQKQIT